MKVKETTRRYHDRRRNELKTLRSPWEDHWREIADYIAPNRLRINAMEPKGRPDRKHIVDSTTSQALRTLASGMHSGITSPSRPWFRLTTFDPELREFSPVKTYLSKAEQMMREVFQASNIYRAFHTGYADLGAFGQSASILVSDDDNFVRMLPLLHGSFYIGRDENGIANTLYREIWRSCENIVRQFGYKNCSTTIQNCYDRGNYSERFLIHHAIEPRKDREPGKMDARNKRFLSNYWEDGNGNSDKMLMESGFDRNPIIAPLWEELPDDDYGYSPGMDALPDAKMLMKSQMRKGEAIDKKVRPPMVGPTSMQNNPTSTMPGSITYVDDPTGKGFRAAIDVSISITELREDIRETQQRVERAFFADLFLMLSQMDGIQPRNTFEIAERKEEKLLALGPVLENIYGGQLAPVIDQTFNMMALANRFGPPPPELEEQSLKIEYVSMLAQAQKAIGTGAIERTFSFAGNLAAVKPDIMDKLDADQAIDEYAEMVGAPPSVVVPDDKVDAVRKSRQEQMQQAQMAEQAPAMAQAAKSGAEAAKVLSEVPNGGTGGALLKQIGLA